jgi:hypothetical protein
LCVKLVTGLTVFAELRSWKDSLIGRFADQVAYISPNG